MRLKCEICGNPFIGRRDARYCSGKCKQKSVRQIQIGYGKKGDSITTHPRTDSYLNRVSDPDTKSGRVPLAKCPTCGLSTKQQFIDRFTPVFHDGCYGEPTGTVAIGDRTAQFPKYYSPNADQSIIWEIGRYQR